MAWIADAVKARLKTDTSAIRPLNALGMNESSRPMKGREKDASRECLDRSAAAQSGHARSRYEGQAAWIYWRRGEMSKARGAILKSDQDLRKDHQNWNPAELLVSSGGAGRVKEITPTPGRASRFGLRTQFFFAAQEARRQNRPEEMLANLREALRYRPDWVALSRSMMRWRDGYMSLGRLDEAIAEYERGLKLFPGMARARFHLAEAYRRKAIPLRPRRNSANFSNCGSMAIPICRKLPKLAGGPGSRLQAGCYNKIWRQNLQFSMKPVL
jgi:tetratricopeptide (TPR) repeat protein